MNNETTPSVQTPAGIAVQGLAGFVVTFAIVAALELALTELACGSISGRYCPRRRLPFNKFATKACAIRYRRGSITDPQQVDEVVHSD
jgi:hypothetical protein